MRRGDGGPALLQALESDPALAVLQQRAAVSSASNPCLPRIHLHLPMPTCPPADTSLPVPIALAATLCGASARTSSSATPTPSRKRWVPAPALALPCPQPVPTACTQPPPSITPSHATPTRTLTYSHERVLATPRPCFVALSDRSGPGAGRAAPPRLQLQEEPLHEEVLRVLPGGCWCWCWCGALVAVNCLD